jgi:anti-sigma B factor antagonist
MAFSVEPEPDNGRRFRLSGELDLATSAILMDAVSAATAGDGPIRLDLSDVMFIDSSGIRSLLLLSEALGKRGNLILVRPSESVERTLRLVGLDHAENLMIENADPAPPDAPGA